MSAAAAAALLATLALSGLTAAAAPAALGARLAGGRQRGLPPGCLYEGRWFSAGAAVPTGEACLQCACARGALACRRRACAAPPAAPPPRCRLLHRRGACCPELHCPDGVTVMEHGASGRSEDEEDTFPAPAHVFPACVEGGTVYAAGSAMRSARACEQCSCVRGARRCAGPACAPPPRGCRARAAPGLCCADHYHCGDHSPGTPISQFLSTSNALTSARKDHDASLSPSKKESTSKTTLASIYLVKNTRITSATNNLVSTTKVKRKTSDPPPPDTSTVASQNSTVVVETTRTSEVPTTTIKLPVTAQATSTTSEASTEPTSTEQPEGSVRIMINGTINCTAELSSTSLPLNFTSTETDMEELDEITKQSHPRTPLIDVSTLEDHTFSPDDIITDRNVYGDFDESESFVINVTSSLRTNTSHTSTAKPATSKPTPIVTKVSIPTDIAEALNSSKKTKGDYDFDYTEPTLPPSLPNLKIIPFVAADAVVEEELPKEAQPYSLQRQDKFPVYYPAVGNKDPSFTQREDGYHSTQYPVFITDKGDGQYLSLSQDADPTSSSFSNAHEDMGPSGNAYTAPSSLEGRIDQKKPAVTPEPVPRTTFKLESPKVNLFSPPVETEGGFVPKGSSDLIEEYYAAFPSTSSGPAVSRPTTSMSLDITNGGCVSSDGRRIPPGGSLSAACAECACVRGALRCTPRACAAPPPRCRRRPADAGSGDLCCGELICDEQTTTAKQTTTPVKYTAKAPDETSKSTTEAVTHSPIAHSTQVTVDAATGTSIEAQGPIHQIQNDLKATTVISIKTDTLNNFTTPGTTEKVEQFTKPMPPTTTQAPPSKEPEPEDSLEYEEEEEEGGFSFGNVLKLLLSGDSYDTTTTASKPLQTTTKPTPVKLTTTTRVRPPPPAPYPTVAPFVPLPALPYGNAKVSHNPINRIDHLVLGQATAIKRTNVRPLAPPIKPANAPRPAATGSTQRIATKPTEVTRREEHNTSTEIARPPGGGGLSGLSGGLLKLAGCNIYGQMYRVGRIIAELSTPCQECWCTELGVQCEDLKC